MFAKHGLTPKNTVLIIGGVKVAGIRPYDVEKTVNVSFKTKANAVASLWAIRGGCVGSDTITAFTLAELDRFIGDSKDFLMAHR